MLQRRARDGGSENQPTPERCRWVNYLSRALALRQSQTSKHIVMPIAPANSKAATKIHVTGSFCQN